MSHQAHVDQLIGAGLLHAAILDHDGTYKVFLFSFSFTALLVLVTFRQRVAFVYHV